MVTKLVKTCRQDKIPKNDVEQLKFRQSMATRYKIKWMCFPASGYIYMEMYGDQSQYAGYYARLYLSKYYTAKQFYKLMQVFNA